MPSSPVDVVPIPAGAIVMENARTGLSRDVIVQPFGLATTTVTRDAGKPLHPVTWFDAVSWCNRTSLSSGLRPAYENWGRDVHWDVSADGFRLPTEAEWEWACRAGTDASTYGPLDVIAWTEVDTVDGP